MPRDGMLCNAMPCYVVLCYATRCQTMRRYAMVRCSSSLSLPQPPYHRKYGRLGGPFPGNSNHPEPPFHALFWLECRASSRLAQKGWLDAPGESSVRGIYCSGWCCLPRRFVSGPSHWRESRRNLGALRGGRSRRPRGGRPRRRPRRRKHFNLLYAPRCEG